MTVDSAQPVTCKQRRAAKNWRTSQTGLFLVLQVSAQPVKRALFQYFCSGIEAKSELIRVEGDLAHSCGSTKTARGTETDVRH